MDYLAPPQLPSKQYYRAGGLGAGACGSVCTVYDEDGNESAVRAAIGPCKFPRSESPRRALLKPTFERQTTLVWPINRPWPIHANNNPQLDAMRSAVRQRRDRGAHLLGLATYQIGAELATVTSRVPAVVEIVHKRQHAPIPIRVVVVRAEARALLEAAHHRAPARERPFRFRARACLSPTVSYEDCS